MYGSIIYVENPRQQRFFQNLSWDCRYISLRWKVFVGTFETFDFCESRLSKKCAFPELWKARDYAETFCILSDHHLWSKYDDMLYSISTLERSSMYSYNLGTDSCTTRISLVTYTYTPIWSGRTPHGMYVSTYLESAPKIDVYGTPYVNYRTTGCEQEGMVVLKTKKGQNKETNSSHLPHRVYSPSL